MLTRRAIPCLLLHQNTLVKTVRFGKPSYIGDPINTVRIFNELEVDELVFLDISASREQRPPHYDLLRQITNECFMPLSYGGGVNSVEIARTLFRMGFEKVVVNSAAFENQHLIPALADAFGSQSVVVALDVKKDWLGRYRVTSHSGQRTHSIPPDEWAHKVVEAGAGELLVTAIHQEGTWRGYDTALIRSISDAVSVPVIAHGGAGTLEHLAAAVQDGHASAVALGSMVVYQKQGMGVLINMPDKKRLREALR